MTKQYQIEFANGQRIGLKADSYYIDEGTITFILDGEPVFSLLPAAGAVAIGLASRQGDTSDWGPAWILPSEEAAETPDTGRSEQVADHDSFIHDAALDAEEQIG